MTLKIHRGPYDQSLSHTGRELALMLEGKKPFAAFADYLPLPDPEIIPEESFEPHVISGKFLKRKYIEERVDPQGQSKLFCRVMYAVPGEEWRFDALLTLWRLCDRHGWNDGFEKLEGYLYGYETEIDPFFSINT